MPSKPPLCGKLPVARNADSFYSPCTSGVHAAIDVTKAGDRSGITASRRDSEITCEAAFPNGLGARLFGHRRALHRRGETRFCDLGSGSRYTKHLLTRLNAR